MTHSPAGGGSRPSKLLFTVGDDGFFVSHRLPIARDAGFAVAVVVACPVTTLGDAIRDEGLIDWKGCRDDIPAVWKESHVAVLPSYYAEGLPKALLEAASSGRPIVAADVPGRREIALLVPPLDPAASGG